MNRYLWCEDSKSGFLFWQAIFRAMFPDISVETKSSNTGLRKAVSRIRPDENQYYILMDSAVDNPDVIREIKRLRSDSLGKENVHLIKLHSFEFSLLAFELLEQWVFSAEDELRDKRQDLLHARSVFIKSISAIGESSALAAFKQLFDAYEKKNSEQIAASLLFEITRNTGFETDKSQLGPCFINECCEWATREEDDRCGLDSNRLSAAQKAQMLMERSPLKAAFEEVGLA